VTAASVGLALLAGLLSILSPCVLPLVPIVLGTAASRHRFAPAALAAGLAISFTVIGLFVATIGFTIGLTAELFRIAAGVMLTAVGVVLLLPALQMRLATAAAPLANLADGRMGAMQGGGLSGLFGMGMRLGAVWVPCVGPTLGAASLLAAQGQDLPQVAIVMLAFGIGAAFPLLALGLLTREAMARWRGRLMSAGSGLKAALGLLFVAVGIAVATGFDKRIETALVDASPQWLTELTTRF
jgi:cytochrome c biogenesis protein CcdA